MRKEFQEIVGFLRRIYVFSCLDPEELAKIVPCLKIISFSKESFIYKIGEQPDGLYLVKSGIVAVHPRLQEESDLHYLGRGNYFGETALFGEKTRENDVQAVTYVEVFFLKKESLTFRQLFSFVFFAGLTVVSKLDGYPFFASVIIFLFFWLKNKSVLFN